MNPAGILLMIAGTWVCTQVFAGNALQRLGVLPDGENSGPPRSRTDAGSGGGAARAAVKAGQIAAPTAGAVSGAVGNAISGAGQPLLGTIVGQGGQIISGAIGDGLRGLRP